MNNISSYERSIFVEQQQSHLIGKHSAGMFGLEFRGFGGKRKLQLDELYLRKAGGMKRILRQDLGVISMKTTETKTNNGKE